MRQLTFIINPAAGGCRRRTRRLIELIGQAQPGAERLVTVRPGQARQWAEARREDPHRAVIAVGGDGTVHEVVNGLVDGQAALGVLPAGSGNDFAKMLATPGPAEQALAWFAAANTRPCDVGRVAITSRDGPVQQRYFINGLGIGLEAVVADSARRARYLRGFSRYLVAALWHLVTYRPPHMLLVEDDGEVDAPQFLVAIGNGRCAGGRFRLTPEAMIDDGQLDLCRAATTSRLRLVRILPSVIRGTHGRFPEIRMSRSRDVRIRCADGCMVHADGEVLARDAVDIRVGILPGSLPLLV